MAGDFGYYSYFNRFGGIELSFKSIGMKSSMVEFSTDNKETLNKMAKKFNSKDYNIVSYQLEEKTVGEMTTYYVTMVIKSKNTMTKACC